MANSVHPDLGLRCLPRPIRPKAKEYYGKIWCALTFLGFHNTLVEIM